MNRAVVARLMVLILAVTSCASRDAAAEAPSWGSEPTRYFEELATTYSDNDLYGILDFYTPSAEVEIWRGDMEGGAPVTNLLRSNSGDLGQELEAVYLGGHGALTLVLRQRSGDQEAIVHTINDGLIAHEIVFDLAASLARSVRASPDVIATYEGLYQAYAEAWSSETAEHRARLYARDAMMYDAFSGLETSGRESIVGSATADTWSTVVNTAISDAEVSAEGLSVYLGPRGYLQDPERAVGVYAVTNPEGCTRHVAVEWLLDAGLIVEERRYAEVESFRRCAQGPLPTGWWTDLALPQPSDQVVTEIVRTTAGQQVEIHNGTPLLVDLLRNGLARFAAAGLQEPIIDTVTFEPSRKCADRSGRFLNSEISRDLFLCMYESDLCPGSGECSKPTLNVRIAVLHELGHAWMLHWVGEETEQQILEVADLESWDSQDVPWTERGAEYSADVLAWGLLDEAIPMVRFGAPPCRQLTDSFRLLTGTDPLRDAGDCPDA
jgi:hypothetical protein